MAVFVDVYIEGTDDTSPPAIKRAVTSLARCLAIPESRAHALLAQGRAKVRSNLAPELANELVRLLEKAGVRAVASPVRQTSPGLTRKDSGARVVPTTGERSLASGLSTSGERRLATGGPATPKQSGTEEEAITGVFEASGRNPTPFPPGFTPQPTPTPSEADERTDPRVKPR